MLDAIEGMSFAYVLIGVLWAIVLGFAAGNYACSLVHRLPRGRLILDKTPYCGNCGTLLQVRDLFPVVSALLLRHRCRYCKQPYPVSHTWTELLVGLLFVLAFFQYNFTEQFLLVALIGIFLITLAAIEANENIVMNKILICLAVFGALNRTLIDHTIYDFFLGGLFSLILGAVLWRKQIKQVGHIYALPPQAQLMAIGGLCVGDRAILPFAALFGLFYVTDWLIRKATRTAKPPLVTVSFGIATIILVLYPKLLLLVNG